MNLRSIAKANTHQMIIDKSIDLFNLKGFINTKTQEISKYCGISHGNLFMHFGTKDNLIEAVLDFKIKQIATSLIENCQSTDNTWTLAEEYLNLVEINENFFYNLYRELPFFNEYLQNAVLSLEIIIRNLFFVNIKTNFKNMTEDRISSILTPYFSLIFYYLVNKKQFTSSDCIIPIKRCEIIETLKTLLKKELS